MTRWARIRTVAAASSTTSSFSKAGSREIKATDGESFFCCVHAHRFEHARTSTYTRQMRRHSWLFGPLWAPGSPAGRLRPAPAGSGRLRGALLASMGPGEPQRPAPAGSGRLRGALWASILYLWDRMWYTHTNKTTVLLTLFHTPTTLLIPHLGRPEASASHHSTGSEHHAIDYPRTRILANILATVSYRVIEF